jgi:NTE family protein
VFQFFGKKAAGGSEYGLEEIPLLAALSPAEVRFVEKRIRLVDYKKNDIVYKQGDEADAFYVVRSGRLRVFTRASDGYEKTVSYLYRGDYFGEISILTGSPHSVTVEALNDSLVLRLDKKDFSELLKNAPALALHLSRSLSLKLRDSSEGERRGGAKIVSIYNLRHGVGQTTFAVNFAVSLREESRRAVLYIDMTPPGKGVKDLLGPSGTAQVLDLGATEVSREGEVAKYLSEYQPGINVLHLTSSKSDGFSSRRLGTLLSYLISQFHYVLIDLPREVSESAFKVLTQSDMMYVLTEGQPEDLDETRGLISKMKDAFTFADDQIKIILMRTRGDQTVSIRQVRGILGRPVFVSLPHASELRSEARSLGSKPHVLTHPDSAYSFVVRFVARDLAGRLTGIALGSGAAHGFAHIGVLKVLEEARIPVDMVAGSSMGALLGALWAAGRSAQELEDIALALDKKSAFFNIIGIDDFSIAHQGFFKGRQVMRYLRGLLGTKTFEDLRCRLRVVATNLFTSEEVVFDEGDVADAVRASISIPGIFRPHRINGKVLIDGGVVDPLPVDVLARQGVRKIIAVNVLSGPSDIMERKEVVRRRAEKIAERVRMKGPIREWFYGLGKRLGRRYEANIFNVIMNTIQFMEYSIAQTSTQNADVVIHPVVADAQWMEFYSARKFIEMGERKTREALAEIQKLVAE